MISRSRLTSKLSTLDAAQRMFFIVVVLGIRQSLGLLSPIFRHLPFLRFLALLIGGGLSVSVI
jgi:hypothetical protein